MSQLYYDDGTVSVTENEIRAPGYTLYLDNVSAVSVASFSLGKFMLIPLSFSLIPLVMVPVIARGFLVFALIPFVPLLLVTVVALFFRKTRIMLQTTGGPVIAGQKFGFGDHSADIARFNQMKRAIEDAKAGRPPGSVPTRQPQRFTI